MDLLLPLLPASWRPYAKTVMAVLGAVLFTVTTMIPDLPSWVGIAVTIATALGVYTQPNSTPEPVLEDGRTLTEANADIAAGKHAA